MTTSPPTNGETRPLPLSLPERLRAVEVTCEATKDRVDELAEGQRSLGAKVDAQTEAINSQGQTLVRMEGWMSRQDEKERRREEEDRQRVEVAREEDARSRSLRHGVKQYLVKTGLQFLGIVVLSLGALITGSETGLLQAVLHTLLRPPDGGGH